MSEYILEVVGPNSYNLEVITGGKQGPQGVQGVVGPQGEKGDVSYGYTALYSISAFRMVTQDGSGQLIYASNDNLTHATRPFGVTTAAIGASSSGSVRMFGEVTNPAWSWNTSLAVYLDTNGNLTQIPPSVPGTFLMVVGYPVSVTTLFVRPQPPIILA